jgi:hypothetical protein
MSKFSDMIVKDQKQAGDKGKPYYYDIVQAGGKLLSDSNFARETQGTKI